MPQEASSPLFIFGQSHTNTSPDHLWVGGSPLSPEDPSRRSVIDHVSRVTREGRPKTIDAGVTLIRGKGGVLFELPTQGKDVAGRASPILVHVPTVGEKEKIISQVGDHLVAFTQGTDRHLAEGAENALRQALQKELDPSLLQRAIRYMAGHPWKTLGGAAVAATGLGLGTHTLYQKYKKAYYMQEKTAAIIPLGIAAGTGSGLASALSDQDISIPHMAGRAIASGLGGTMGATLGGISGTALGAALGPRAAPFMKALTYGGAGLGALLGGMGMHKWTGPGASVSMSESPRMPMRQDWGELTYHRGIPGVVDLSVYQRGAEVCFG